MSSPDAEDTWWEIVLSTAITIPTHILQTLRRLTKYPKPSTLTILHKSRTPHELLRLISNNLHEIQHDVISLAHIRILASQFLLAEIFETIQKLQSRLLSLRLGIGDIDEVGQRKIRLLVDVLLQFTGMHVSYLDDVRLGLIRNHQLTSLTKVIVTCCRQASSFIHAVSESKSTCQLYSLLKETVRTSIGSTTSNNVAPSVREQQQSKQNIVLTGTEQLGQFLAQGPPSINMDMNMNMNINSTTATGNINNTSTSSSTRDVSLTLQIVQSELSNVSTINRRTISILDRDFSSLWNIQRKPLRYLGLSAITLESSRKLYIHSRFLGGSGQFEDKILQYTFITQSYIHNNVYVPIISLSNKVFTTSNLTSVSSIRMDEKTIEHAQSSLRNMIIDFTERNLNNVPGALEAAQQGSMKVVMEAIVEQAKHPMKNVLRGSLGQALFVQVQKVKCDVEELMLKTKQVLRAQELNLALVAIVPSVLTIASLIYVSTVLVENWKARGKQVIVSGEQTARFLLGDVYTALVALGDLNVALFEQDHSLLIGGFESGDVGAVRENGGDGSTGDDGGGSRDSEGRMRQAKALGTLHAKIYELEEIVVNNGALIRMASRVRLRFRDDLNFLRNCLFSLDDRKNHVIKMLLCYPFLRE